MSESDTQNEAINLFGPIDDDWESTTRSIRISGKVTSVRLENFHWRIVKEIAEDENLLLSQLMTKLSRLASNSQGEHVNFTSFVRVCCARYLQERNKAAPVPSGAVGAGPVESTEFRAVS